MKERHADSRQRPLYRALSADFRLMLYLVWRHLELAEPTPVQYDIARFLQHGPRRKAVLAFRGVGKSSIYAAYGCWRLLRDPNEKLAVISATKPLAEQISAFMRKLCAEMPALEAVRPAGGARDAADAWDAAGARPAKDPSVRAFGVGGQITGARADQILADDVEILSVAASAGARQKLREQVREFEAVLKPGGAVTFLGTPQSSDTLYAELPDRGYALRIWPVEVPSDPSVYQGRLGPLPLKRLSDGWASGRPLDPSRFSEADLAERRAALGRRAYALQYLLDARADDDQRRPLLLRDIAVADLPEGGRLPSVVTIDACAAAAPAATDMGAAARVGVGMGLGDDAFCLAAPSGPWLAPEASVLAIDPSGRGRDETGYAVVKALNARLFLTASGGIDGGYGAEALSFLSQLASREAVDAVLIEANFGDGMFGQLLRPHLDDANWSGAIRETRTYAAKEARILGALEPVLSQGRLVVSQSIVREDAAAMSRDPRKSLFHQLTRMSTVRGALVHDDRLDALAIAVADMRRHLAQSPEAAAAAAARRLDKLAARAMVSSMSARRPRRRGLLRQT